MSSLDFRFTLVIPSKLSATTRLHGEYFVFHIVSSVAIKIVNITASLNDSKTNDNYCNTRKPEIFVSTAVDKLYWVHSS